MTLSNHFSDVRMMITLRRIFRNARSSNSLDGMAIFD